MGLSKRWTISGDNALLFRLTPAREIDVSLENSKDDDYMLSKVIT